MGGRARLNFFMVAPGHVIHGPGVSHPQVMVCQAWAVPDAPGDANMFVRTLARQIRQDLWRGLARVRGLRPVVEVQLKDGQVAVAAGAALMVAAAPRDKIQAEVATLLSDPAHRKRWMANASRLARC